jgi:putative phosphoribosyl transferase
MQHPPKVFRSREHAAELLSQHLRPFASPKALVVAIPRGAVPMARIIATELQLPWDIVVAHKITSRFNPEYALGALAENDTTYIRSPHLNHPESPDSRYLFSISEPLREEKKRLGERMRLYESHRHHLSDRLLRGKTVILVDDGIATGATLIAAIRSLKKRSPERIIVAAPVASPAAVHLLENENVELQCLISPDTFSAVSEFYQSFPQVSDQEVIDLLDQKHKAVA